MKKKVTLLVVFVVIVLIFASFANLARKTYIIAKYCKESEKYTISTNFYKKTTDEDSTTEIWRKGNIATLKRTTSTSENIIHWGEYEVWLFNTTNSDNEIKKIAVKLEGDSEIFPTLIGDYIKGENLIDYIKIALKCKITIEKTNDIECYKIVIDDNIEEYINKEDLKIVKIKEGNITNNIEYKIDIVKDEDVKVPNINEYTIINKK